MKILLLQLHIIFITILHLMLILLMMMVILLLNAPEFTEISGSGGTSLDIEALSVDLSTNNASGGKDMGLAGVVVNQVENLLNSSDFEGTNISAGLTDIPLLKI